MLRRIQTISLCVSLALITLCPTAFSAETAVTLHTNEISAIQEKAKKDAAQMALPQNGYEGVGRRKAEEAHTLYQSEEFQAKIAKERDRIQEEIFGRTGPSSYYDTDSKGDKASGGLGPHERIYIFLSSSVPKETLRRYTRAAGALDDRNVKFVMRGFVGGAKYVKPTVGFVKDLLFEDPECDPTRTPCKAFHTNVIIDPLLFEHYGITGVPAFVYATVDHVKDPEKSEGLQSNITVSTSFSVYGDVSLEYVLTAFEKETRSPGVSALLMGLRKGFY
jgi:conjugal transfer pilus assembly protein TrbC